MELEQSLLSAFLKDRKAYETFERIGHIDEFSPVASYRINQLQAQEDMKCNQIQSNVWEIKDIWEMIRN